MSDNCSIYDKVLAVACTEEGCTAKAGEICLMDGASGICTIHLQRLHDADGCGVKEKAWRDKTQAGLEASTG